MPTIVSYVQRLDRDFPAISQGSSFVAVFSANLNSSEVCCHHVPMMHATRGSKITNQPARLAAIDGRSSDARRRRDLIMTYTDALGGADKVSAATVRHLARAAGRARSKAKARPF